MKEINKSPDKEFKVMNFKWFTELARKLSQ